MKKINNYDINKKRNGENKIKMKNIKNYNLEELKQELISLGEKPFRAEQIFNWLYKEKVKKFDEDKSFLGVKRKTKTKLYHV